MTAGFDRLDPVIQHHIVNSLGWPGLRPLQDESVAPISTGSDAILLAPTAGGKTEAAMFPLLTRMQTERWTGISVLYICPLKALLNNLQPRIAGYAEWMGRDASTWHGDVTSSARGRIKRDRPDVLLTTPESLESMLVSEGVDAAEVLGGVQAVVVDEVHAFAGDDRGWHLLAVLARLETLLGRKLQRVGMSATVGNPDQLLSWLQGGSVRAGLVIAPSLDGGAVVPDITVDSVGSVENASKVIATLHKGEKRLVFVDSRRLAEELGKSLRERGITTFVSHSSLSAAERRESEEAFAEARDCVIVATSTLELGIDVGDLDRVIQINAPRTVSSFLQRLGRTGRRPGSTRNCLFLCITEEAVLDALGMLQCWSAGWVEPVLPTPEPRHIVAQQILASALQTRRVPLTDWQQGWGSLPLFDDTAPEIMSHLLSEGFLEQDSGTAFIGLEAEKQFGRRHFMELLAVFTAAPEFKVLAGRDEIGSVETALLTEEVEGGRILLLGGRSWAVTHIDWKRRFCYVEATEIAGKAKWSSIPDGPSFEIARGMREVLLGSLPQGVTLTRRAVTTIDGIRDVRSGTVTDGSFVIARDEREDWRWWTWAGAKANRTLGAWIPDLIVPRQMSRADCVRLHRDLSVQDIRDGLAAARAHDAPRPLPAVDKGALRGLKFSVALPEQLARQTMSSRLVNSIGAERVLADEAQIRR
ncbi:DEAD/DEAH box helicase [Rhodococcus erythropolis]|uniref:DEAD/DEAH box helicase n=1 Tax=Rhodococcus TaxID=1827 RepID=UPI001A30CB2E|nr:DEAD/DEAH box helicase [Rhodococcus sp. (in: high G+C Gram-positive bacteria)]MBJ7480053.1 DEAD/DEAH box helicase [Rhodococcus sp. (in: high G+C Gram-positive bacteria)]